MPLPLRPAGLLIAHDMSSARRTVPAMATPSSGQASAFFEGFTLDHVEVDGVTLRVRHGGDGPPVVLLHGHPRTHTTWYAVAPQLARTHTVVCPDLRGYGRSSKPDVGVDPAAYSKRAMAADIVGLMRRLGHDHFEVVGHDRGSYVALRTALDHPATVTRLAVLDSVPIVEALDRCDARFASLWWHWFFLGQRARPAERVISADPDAWYAVATTNTPQRLGVDNHADFLAAIRDPATVLAMCEDYRAGLSHDRHHDATDRAAGRRIRCPTLVLWSSRDDMADLYGDPLSVWEAWADDLRGGAIDSGHHMAEEAPDELADALGAFLA
jgi:haloacetate dehalogenase